jgi:hypothetical protein
MFVTKGIMSDRNTKFPSRDKIAKIHLHYFQNAPEAAVQGRSEHSFNVSVYYYGNKAKAYRGQWSRTVQLLEPDVFIKWPRAKHEAGLITDDVLQKYEEHYANAQIATEQGDAILFGHIARGASKKYFPGQFIIAILSKDGDMGAIIIGSDESYMISLQDEKTAKKERAPKKWGEWKDIDTDADEAI